jgi:glucosamine-6-phosphate deaminase
MNSIIEKINRGLKLPKGKKILHTSPHHDDDILSYHPIMQELISDNQNSFLYLTSGHHAVTDAYMFKALYAVPEFLLEYPPEKNSFFDAITMVYGISDLYSLKEKVRSLKTDYFPSKGTAEKDSNEIAILKGYIREFEAEKLLSIFNVSLLNINHFRAKFYDGGDSEADVLAIKKYIEDLNPDIITVLSEAENLGPKTHHTALNVIMRALEQTHVKPVIWKYRNVWSSFAVEEVDLMIPVSEKQMQGMHEAFMNCFQTQIIAAFRKIS